MYVSASKATEFPLRVPTYWFNDTALSVDDTSDSSGYSICPQINTQKTMYQKNHINRWYSDSQVTESLLTCRCSLVYLLHDYTNPDGA